VIWTLVVFDVSSKYINPFGYDEHPDLTHHDINFSITYFID